MTFKGGRRSHHLPATIHSPMLYIRAASEADRDFIGRLSLQVFSQFGDYATFLPSYLDEPAVFTLIAERDGTPSGFLMLAFVQTEPEEPGKTLSATHQADQELIGEILAIAVVPDHHRGGIGGQLMAHALESAKEFSATSVISSLQLNVAHTNSRALAFFEQLGFRVLKQNDGTYPAGQRSIRMIHPLPTIEPKD